MLIMSISQAKLQTSPWCIKLLILQATLEPEGLHTAQDFQEKEQPNNVLREAGS